MPELVDVLKECIELVESEEYLIDKVIISEKIFSYYIEDLKQTLNEILQSIKNEFPEGDNFKYRRLIFPYGINPDDEGMIKYNGETWEVLKCSNYDHGGYEVFLKREK